MVERQFVKLLDVSSNLTSDSKTFIGLNMPNKIKIYVDNYRSEVFNTIKKCTMCGSTLNTYYPYSYLFYFYNQNLSKPIIYRINEFNNAQPGINGKYIRKVMCSSFKKRLSFKKYTKNEPTHYYCVKCGQLYNNAQFADDGKPIYNFRELPLRKRT